MYTESELNIIKMATDGFYECNEDCYRIGCCNRHKVFNNNPNKEQLNQAGVLHKCNLYCEEDK